TLSAHGISGGQRDDAAMAAGNRRHEDHHRDDDKDAFAATVGAWDDKLTKAAANHSVYTGATNADAEAALYAAMGGMPNQIADAYWNAVDKAGNDFHRTAAGGKVHFSNPTSSDDCSTSDVDGSNPS